MIRAGFAIDSGPGWVDRIVIEYYLEDRKSLHEKLIEAGASKDRLVIPQWLAIESIGGGTDWILSRINGIPYVFNQDRQTWTGVFAEFILLNLPVRPDV